MESLKKFTWLSIKILFWLIVACGLILWLVASWPLSRDTQLMIAFAFVAIMVNWTWTDYKALQYRRHEEICRQLRQMDKDLVEIISAHQKLAADLSRHGLTDHPFFTRRSGS